jgi:hypothetical protein
VRYHTDARPCLGYDGLSTYFRARQEAIAGFGTAQQKPGEIKRIVIRIIKRNAKPELPLTASKEVSPTQKASATVNDWIAESRQIRLDEDNSSRNIIAGWATEAGRQTNTSNKNEPGK